MIQQEIPNTDEFGITEQNIESDEQSLLTITKRVETNAMAEKLSNENGDQKKYTCKEFRFFMGLHLMKDLRVLKS